MSRNTPDRARSAGADAILATTFLTITLGLGVTAGARPAPLPLFAGAVCTVLAEAIAGHQHELVRRWWANQTVRIIAIWVGLAALTGGTLTAPTPTISITVGAISTYLLLFALVATNVLLPPSEWWS